MSTSNIKQSFISSYHWLTDKKRINQKKKRNHKMFDIERNMKRGPQYLTHLLPPSHLSSGTLVLLITEKSEMDSLFSLYLIVKFLFDFIFIFILSRKLYRSISFSSIQFKPCDSVLLLLLLWHWFYSLFSFYLYWLFTTKENVDLKTVQVLNWWMCVWMGLSFFPFFFVIFFLYFI